jgi:hypothetical protein
MVEVKFDVKAEVKVEVNNILFRQATAKFLIGE